MTTFRTVEDVVQAAHDLADRKGLCSEYDDFMEELGVGGRSRCYSVEVDLRFSVRVHVTASSNDEAESNVDEDDVREAVKEYVGSYGGFTDSDWDVDFAEVCD